MPQNFDWDYLRHRYVTGDVTLEELAETRNAPSLRSIKRHASTEKWTAQRFEYRHRTGTKTREVAQTTEADISARHIKMAQALQAKALRALQALDPAMLPPSEIRQYLATAAEIERKAAGMDNKITLRGVGSLDKLSDEELLTLARRIGVLGDPEAGTATPSTPLN